MATGEWEEASSPSNGRVGWSMAGPCELIRIHSNDRVSKSSRGGANLQANGPPCEVWGQQEGIGHDRRGINIGTKGWG